MTSHIDKSKLPESIYEQWVMEQVQRNMRNFYKAYNIPVPKLPWQITLPADDDSIPY